MWSSIAAAKLEFDEERATLVASFAAKDAAHDACVAALNQAAAVVLADSGHPEDQACACALAGLVQSLLRIN